MGLDWSSLFRKKIGDGSSSFFWLDRWCGEKCFMERFPRAYRAERNKGALVGDKGSFSEEGWVWSELCSRNLRGRVRREVEEMSSCLNNISLHAGTKDKWWWDPDAGGVFTVSSLRKLMEARVAGPAGAVIQETCWNTLIPKKVNIFIWRAMQGKIPVRVELDHRGIDVDSILCPMCGADPESADHCLIKCRFADAIWVDVFSWWKWDKFISGSISDIILHPGHAMFSKCIFKSWQAVLWTSMYFLWKYRNEWVFSRKAPNFDRLRADVRAYSFNWISRRGAKGTLCWEKWLGDPILASSKVLS